MRKAVEDACLEELKLKTLCDLKENIGKVYYDQWVLKMSEEEVSFIFNKSNYLKILQLNENLEVLKVTISFTTESYSTSEGCSETKTKVIEKLQYLLHKRFEHLLIMHCKPEQVELREFDLSFGNEIEYMLKKEDIGGVEKEEN
eukprot:Awhi_evm1s10048